MKEKNMFDMDTTLMIAGPISFLLILGRLLSFIRVQAYIKKAHKAQGRIVKLVERSIGGGNHDLFPVFSVTGENGHEVTVTQPSYRPRFKVGAQVDVLYDPQNPTGARIHTWMNFYLFPTL